MSASPPEDREAKELAELQARLEKAQADRAELATATTTRKRLADARAEVEKEERALREETKLSELEETYGPVGKSIKVVNTDAGMIVVKKPNHLLFKKYMDKGDAKTEDLDKLVRPCLVYPDKVTFDRIAEEVPAALLLAANAVIALAGIGREAIQGK